MVALYRRSCTALVNLAYPPAFASGPRAHTCSHRKHRASSAAVVAGLCFAVAGLIRSRAVGVLRPVANLRTTVVTLPRWRDGDRQSQNTPAARKQRR